MRVDFDAVIEDFVTSFRPELARGKTREQLYEAWLTAVAFVGDNDDNSFAPYEPAHGIHERRQLLFYAMAHMLILQARQLQSGGLNGIITSASEGSVSVSVQPYTAGTLTAEYWTQTADGTTYWMLTAKYRLGGRLYAYREAHPYG